VGGISLGCEVSNVRDATRAQQSLVFAIDRAFQKFPILAGKHLTPGFRTNGPSFATSWKQFPRWFPAVVGKV
jgi:hypothetical protein